MWAEADGRWYGTGTVIIDILTSPIQLVVRWNPAEGQWSWLRSTPSLKEASMALRKIDQAFDAQKAQSASVADAGTYPQMIEYLVATTYPDGSKRLPSSLVCLCDGQAWRVCLSDRDNGRVMWKTGSTLTEALESVELALLGDDPSDWRRSADAAGKKRK